MKTKMFSSFMWRFFERIGAQGIQFIVTVLLARMLDPDAFGSVAIIISVISVLQVLIDGGLGNALIQQKEVDEIDCSSVLIFNIFFCVVVYSILYFFSPIIAIFYENDELVQLLRVSGIVIIISGVKNVQQAVITRKLQFKKFFFSTIIGTLISAVIGISMALNGYGPWALVSQYVSNACIDTIIVSITSGWIPQLRFSLSRLKKLLKYGWKLLISTLIDTIYGDFMQLAIGKFFTPESLAFFNRGRSIPNTIVGNINTSIDSVLFPVMSKEQEDLVRVKHITQKAIIISNYLMAPILMIIAFSAYELIVVLLTDKWTPCILYVRVFCIIYMMQPIHTANINAIKALGRSDLVLTIEAVKKIVGLTVFVLTLQYGMKAVIYGYLIVNFFNQIANSYPNKKLIGYGYLNQLRDIAPSIICAILTASLTLGIRFLNFPDALTLVFQFIFGMLLYFMITSLLQLKAFGYFKSFIIAALKEKKSDNTF